jgi:hypothetical protein
MTETFPNPDTAVVMFPVADSVAESFPGAGSRTIEFPAPDSVTELFPGMDSGIAVFPTPPIVTEQRLAQVIMDMTPSASWIVIPWRDAAVFMGMSPGATPFVSVAVNAPVFMDFTQSVTYGVAMDAPQSMNVTPQAVVTPAVSTPAVVSFDQVANGNPDYIDVIVVADVQTAMNIAAQVQLYGFIGAPVSESAVPDALVKPSPSITVPVSMAMVPNASLTVVTFKPSGMNKSGSQTITATSSYTQVTGWVADTTNYPGSTVSSNALVIQSTGTAKISASITNTNSNSSTTTTCRILVNGTIVATGSASPASTGSFPWTNTCTATWTGAVTAGQTVTIEFDMALFASATITAGSVTVINAG